MQYRRIERQSAPRAATAFDTARTIKEAAERAKALHARAQRYRDLAVQLYNRDLAAEVESCALELETEAKRLENAAAGARALPREDTPAGSPAKPARLALGKSLH